MEENTQRLMIIMLIVNIIAIVWFHTSQAASTHGCDKHPIYCQITDNHPTIKRSYAFELSNVIYNKSLKYSLNAKLLTAIFAQESKYDLSEKSCTTGMVEIQPALVMERCIKYGEIGSKEFVTCASVRYEKISVCTDFGIGQIWYKTADSYEFDLDKLTSDLDYSVEAAAIVLKDFKNRYGKKEKDWWTRYNASAPSKRKKYKALVEGYISAN